LSDTFAGIRPIDAPGFIAAQIAGALCATALFAWLAPVSKGDAESVLLPHDLGVDAFGIDAS
jgi:glycerol uptake facilitator-like aquaporin